MNILLIQPPIEDFYDTDVRLFPLGLGLLKAMAKKVYPELAISIVDYHHGHGRKTIAIPPELNYLKKYWGHHDRSPFCGFHHYYHFGASWEYIEADLRKRCPDVIGISALFTPYFREVCKIARIAKSLNPAIKVIVGGSHVSAAPKESLAPEEIDYVMVGEGEHSFARFIAHLKGEAKLVEVPGLGYKDHHNQMYFNPQKSIDVLDEIPLADVSDFNPENYLFEGRPMAFLMTSRSCPHKCSFCSVHQTFGFSYRRRSVSHIFHEIVGLANRGYRVLDFEDDNLTFQRQEFLALMDLIITGKANQTLPADLQLVAMNGISYLSLDQEMLKLMRKAGFTHLNLALVSSDTSVRMSTKRPHTLNKYLEVVKLGNELGFQIVSYQIVGLPFESLSSMAQTLATHAQLPVLLGASLFYLVPRSPIAEHFPELSELDYFKARLSSMAWETELFERDDVYTLFRLSRLINFIKRFPSGIYDSIDKFILYRPDSSFRTQLGIEQLKNLFSHGILFFEGKSRQSRDTSFKSAWALQILRSLPHIGALSGGKIVLTEGLFANVAAPNDLNSPVEESLGGI